MVLEDLASDLTQWYLQLLLCIRTSVFVVEAVWIYPSSANKLVRRGCGLSFGGVFNAWSRDVPLPTPLQKPQRCRLPHGSSAGPLNAEKLCSRLFRMRFPAFKIDRWTTWYINSQELVLKLFICRSLSHVQSNDTFALRAFNLCVMCQKLLTNRDRPSYIEMHSQMFGSKSIYLCCAGQRS